MDGREEKRESMCNKEIVRVYDNDSLTIAERLNVWFLLKGDRAREKKKGKE
jgi:hypothetical protein